MRSQIMTLFGAIIVLVTVIPTVASKLVNRDQIAPSSTLPPCAQVSVLTVDNVQNRPSKPYSVPAVLAHECLLSVPLNITSARAILSEIPLYINWQSTIDVLKNPPTDYVEKIQAAVDIPAGLKAISTDIESGAITSDYEFGRRLYELFAAAHDGHLTYILDVFGMVFRFRRPLPLVSISEDGIKLPAVFVYQDVLGIQFKNISYTPSPIKMIDNTDVNLYLENLSQNGSSQDRDALYNDLFYNLAEINLKGWGSGTGMFTGGGRARFVPLQTNTTLEFVNGSIVVIENIAYTYYDFTNINSGESLKEAIMYIEDIPSSPPVPSNNTGSSTIAEPPVGYPVPVVSGPQNYINGFYIDDPGYGDVAVLTVLSFVGDEDDEIPVLFQATGKKFLEKAWEEGKTKLIIDVRANGGGLGFLAYDLFMQIFPNSDPYGGSRYRFNKAYDFVGQSYSDFASQFPREAGLTNETLRGIQATHFDYHEDTDAEGYPFKSWKEKGGPYDVNGNNYSAISRFNFTGVYVPYQGGINVTGRSNNTRWTAENVVLVTDGYCASACALFAELMIQENGVKTVALGGRRNANKIQAIGGVRGALVTRWSDIRAQVKTAIRLNGTIPDDSDLREYNMSEAIHRSMSATVNSNDAVRRDDESGVALQFKYEEADCRLYYTPEMTVSASAVWKAVVDTYWGDFSKCIGNGDYYAPYDRRANQGKTTSLRPAHGQMHSDEAHKQFRALESTFPIRTEDHQHRDGFVHP